MSEESSENYRNDFSQEIRITNNLSDVEKLVHEKGDDSAYQPDMDGDASKPRRKARKGPLVKAPDKFGVVKRLEDLCEEDWVHDGDSEELLEADELPDFRYGPLFRKRAKLGLDPLSAIIRTAGLSKSETFAKLDAVEKDMLKFDGLIEKIKATKSLQDNLANDLKIVLSSDDEEDTLEARVSRLQDNAKTLQNHNFMHNIRKLEERNQKLEERNQKLEERNQKLEEQNQKFEEQNQKLEERVDSLEKNFKSFFDKNL